MLRFEGDREFIQSPAQLFPKLTDARFLVECVPGKESASQMETDVAVCVLRPGFSFVRGTLEITIQVLERVENTSAKVKIHSKGIGSASDVEASLSLQPKDQGAQVHWIAEIKELGGLLKAVPQGLIKASAQKVIGDAWEELEKKLKG